MEIHSSSLALLPASTTPSTAAQTNNAKLTANKELNSNEQDKASIARQPENGIVNPEQLEQQLEQLKSVSLASENLPANSRIVKALNAYSETVNSPLQEQRTRLAGIDLYV
ncbi:hypothetical protein Q9L42_013215 [Methylomarinum sp. Ch1-1]|uniref:Uncharacterized protein n=1 Tax=Methylomarinum roseum TaxID=3067653 RepID=A0AAU7NRT8_9GAMM|nr:hypothetical protein [Methylomarinum sp. Ch1-1]MDP4520714.1 hypothetical protein [Methylomarinum sp. Ch1-1]